MWEVLACDTFIPLVLTENFSNSKASILSQTLSIPSQQQCNHLLMPDCCRIICHVTKLKSSHDSDFSVLQWAPLSPNLYLVEQHWDMVEQKNNIMDVQLSRSNCAILMSKYGPESLGNVSSTSLNKVRECRWCFT